MSVPDPVVGWLRAAVPAAVAVGITLQDLSIVVWTQVVVAAWYAPWAYAERCIDHRFGVLLGYTRWHWHRAPSAWELRHIGGRESGRHVRGSMPPPATPREAVLLGTCPTCPHRSLGGVHPATEPQARGGSRGTMPA